jgi:predicted nucleic acid-binding protein
MPLKIARQIVSDYLQWDVVENDSDLLIEAMNIGEDFGISLWDAHIVAAAVRVEADILLTEDLDPVQR